MSLSTWRHTRSSRPSMALNSAITPKSTPKKRRPNPLIAMPTQRPILHALRNMTPVLHSIISLSIPVPSEIQLAIATNIVGVQVWGAGRRIRGSVPSPGAVVDVRVVFGVHEFVAIEFGVVFHAGHNEGAADAGLEGEGAHADRGV